MSKTNIWRRALGFCFRAWPHASRRRAAPAVGRRTSRLTVEALEDRLVPAVLTVNSIGDAVQVDNELTLREAILLANGTLTVKQALTNTATTELGLVQGQPAQNQLDTLRFNIPGPGDNTGVHTISPGIRLPEVTDPITIDAYSQPGATANTQYIGEDARLRIAIAPLAIGPILILSGGNSTVKGLILQPRDRSSSLVLVDAGDNHIVGNFIGTNWNATAGLASFRQPALSEKN